MLVASSISQKATLPIFDATELPSSLEHCSVTRTRPEYQVLCMAMLRSYKLLAKSVRTTLRFWAPSLVKACSSKVPPAARLAR